MDRAALTDYLAIEFDSLLAEAGIAPTDTVDGLAPVLDSAAAIVDAQPELSTVWHRPLARYYALDRVVNRFAVNMNVSTGGDTYSLRQQFENAKVLRDEAKRAVAWLVEPAPTVTGTETGGRDLVIEMPFLTGGEEAYGW